MAEMVALSLGKKAESHKMWMCSEGEAFQMYIYKKALLYPDLFLSLRLWSSSVIQF